MPLYLGSQLRALECPGMSSGRAPGLFTSVHVLQRLRAGPRVGSGVPERPLSCLPHLRWGGSSGPSRGWHPQVQTTGARLACRPRGILQGFAQEVLRSGSWLGLCLPQLSGWTSLKVQGCGALVVGAGTSLPQSHPGLCAVGAPAVAHGAEGHPPQANVQRDEDPQGSCGGRLGW